MGGKQDEWDLEQSFRRLYVALNESKEHDLEKVVRRYIEECRLRIQSKFMRRISRRVNLGEGYEALFMTVSILGDRGELWCSVVRSIYPVAPKNFEDIGRLANQPRTQPEPPPRAWPTSSSWGRIPPQED